MTIALHNVSKFFGTDHVVRHVTHEIADGSLTALLGPSGSGKSTLLRMIAGLTTLDEGRIELNGRDVSRLAPRDRRIGFCFQDYAPFRQMTVFDNVAYGLKVQRVARARRRVEVDELLELVRLSAFADRYPHQLSGGQRQRMALARALAIKPSVLLLDEPFGALDAQVRGELRTWVRTLQRDLGITTLLVTHDQTEAMEMADELVLLRDGEVQQAGAPSEIYDYPVNDFVREFLGPVTFRRGVAVRPHDLTVTSPTAGIPSAVIIDVVRLGFEVRVVVRQADNTTCWVQLTHNEALRLQPQVGQGVEVTVRSPTLAALS